MIFPSAENKELVSKYIDKWRMPPANVKYDHINFWKCARDKWVYSPD